MRTMNEQERIENKQNNFINLRPLAISAFALATGVTLCYTALFHGVHFLFCLLGLLPLVLYFILAKKKIRALLYCSLALVCFGIGAGGFALKMNDYHNQPLVEDEYIMEGEIAELNFGVEYSTIVLHNVKIDGERVDGNIKVTCYPSVKQGKEGMRISLTAAVEKAGKAYRYSTFRADMVLGNIKYTATCYQSPTFLGYAFNPFASVRAGIREVLFENLSYEQASLAYALTTGNTFDMEEGLLTSVRYGGVAHLFVVSGLHIGVVFGALSFVLEKCKAPRILRKAIPLLVAFLFCGVCGFSASAVRAFLICSTLSLCSLLQIKADGIEGAGFACLVLLLVNPVYLLSVGFQLSMAAYLAIVFLSPALQKLFSSIIQKFPKSKKICSAVAVMLSVQVFLAPIQLLTFGYLSLWGMLLNLIIIPLFSLFFPVLLVAVLLACIFPVAALYILFVPAYVLTGFAFLFYALDFTLIVKGVTLSILGMGAFYLLFVVLSGRLNFHEKARGIFMPVVCFLTALLFADCLLVNYVPNDTCRIKQTCYYSGYCAALVQTENASVLLVNGSVSKARLQTFLFRNCNRLDGVVIVNENANAVAGSLLYFDGVDIVYVPYGVNLELREKEVVHKTTFTIDGVRYAFGGQNTVYLTVNGVKGVFNGTGLNTDLAIFHEEGRDGLIFDIKNGIITVS